MDIEDAKQAMLTARIADGSVATVRHPSGKREVLVRDGDQIKQLPASRCAVCGDSGYFVIARSCVFCHGFGVVWGAKRFLSLALLWGSVVVFVFQLFAGA